MKRFRWLLLLQLAAVAAYGQSGKQNPPNGFQAQPSARVGSVYRQVVIHEHCCLPDTEEMRIFAPYLSQGLRGKIAATQACAEDWNRKHEIGPPIKSPFSLEMGLFSGTEDSTGSRPTFTVEGASAEPDGSIRIHVRFKQYGRTTNR